MGSHTQSAGTPEIARQSGGDTIPVDDAAALETTLTRIRQRYALHFYLPQGVKAGQQRNIEVALTDAARRRYTDAQVRFRRTYVAPGGAGIPDDSDVSRAPSSNTSSADDQPTVVRAGSGGDSESSRDSSSDSDRPRLRRRPNVSEPSGSRQGPSASSQGGWRREQDPAPPPSSTDSAAAPADPPPAQSQPAQAEPEPEKRGGWRKAKPEDIQDAAKP